MIGNGSQNGIGEKCTSQITSAIDKIYQESTRKKRNKEEFQDTLQAYSTRRNRDAVEWHLVVKHILTDKSIPGNERPWFITELIKQKISYKKFEHETFGKANFDVNNSILQDVINLKSLPKLLTTFTDHMTQKEKGMYRKEDIAKLIEKSNNDNQKSIKSKLKELYKDVQKSQIIIKTNKYTAIGGIIFGVIGAAGAACTYFFYSQHASNPLYQTILTLAAILIVPALIVTVTSLAIGHSIAESRAEKYKPNSKMDVNKTNPPPTVINPTSHEL